MFTRLQELIRKRIHVRSLRQWDQTVRAAQTMDISALRGLRAQAKQMRRRVDDVTNTIDNRLTLPRIGTNAIRKPPQADWVFRPEIWHRPIDPKGIAAIETKSKIGDAATVYHDCQISEMTLRQVRNRRDGDLAPFGLRFDVFKFDGSFLSLVIDLQDDAVDGLRRNHILRVSAEIETEKPLEIFARLNIKHGPNVEQIVRELPFDTTEPIVDFDLQHTQISENRLERIWLDLIFEGPELNEINLRDVTFSRRPRADF